MWGEDLGGPKWRIVYGLKLLVGGPSGRLHGPDFTAALGGPLNMGGPFMGGPLNGGIGLMGCW